MICIRTDMNKHIATGHVMRCLSIAEAIRGRGEEVVFLTADDTAAEFVCRKGFSCRVLGTNWSDLDSEIPEMNSCLRDLSADVLLVDSYSVKASYFHALRGLARTAYIDDLDRETYDVDLLICYAAYYDRFHFEEQYPPTTRLLLGPAYFPLRKSFLNKEKRIVRENIESILLLSGGTDGGILENMADALAAHSLKELNIVCGVMSEEYLILKSKYAAAPNIYLFKAVENMERFMHDADLAISAGGTTLYELCACGTPAISYSVADNQLDNVRSFSRMGLIPYAGDVRNDDVAATVIKLIGQSDRGERARRSEKMRRLVDGCGADRIADALIALKRSSCQEG